VKHMIFLLIVICFWALPAQAQLGLALVPMRVEIRIAPGGQHTNSVRLSNDSASPLRVRAEALDWYIDDTMTPQFGSYYEQEQSHSCRAWLQINPREFDMEASGTERVRYTLRVPEGTPEGEYHCGAGFVTLPPLSAEDTPMGVRMAVRAVTAIYVVIGEPASAPALQDLSLRSLPNGTWQAVALFRNEGLRHFRVHGFVEVQDANGQMLETVEYAPIPVLPQRDQAFPLPLKTVLPPGTYRLHTQADVGLAQVLEGTMQVEVAQTPTEAQ